LHLYNSTDNIIHTKIDDIYLKFGFEFGDPSLNHLRDAKEGIGTLAAAKAVVSNG